MAEPAEVLASLTPFAQVGYGIATAFGLGGLGLWQFFKSKGEERDKAKAKAEAEEHEHFDAGELLSAAPVAKFMSDISDLAATSRIIAEGVKNISAAATVFAKTREDGYDEMVVQRAVDERWRELMGRDREDRPPRGDRRRGQPSGGWGGS